MTSNFLVCPHFHLSLFLFLQTGHAQSAGINSVPTSFCSLCSHSGYHLDGFLPWGTKRSLICPLFHWFKGINAYQIQSRDVAAYGSETRFAEGHSLEAAAPQLWLPQPLHLLARAVTNHWGQVSPLAQISCKPKTSFAESCAIPVFVYLRWTV